MATTDNEDVNVAIFASPNVRGTLLEGRVSDFLDVARPSRRLLLEDAAPPSGTTRLYAAVIVPYRSASPTPDLSNLALSQDGERIGCSFALDGQPYALIWTKTGIARAESLSRGRMRQA